MKDVERRFINPQQGALDTVLPDAAAYAAVERDVLVSNIDVTNDLTVRTQTGQTINGVPTVVVGPGNAVLFLSDGSGWRTVGLPVGGTRAHLNHALAQSIPSGAVTQLTFNNPRYDNGGYISGSTFVVPANGVYAIGAGIEFAPSALGNTRILELRINGATPIAIQQGPPMAGGFTTNLAVATQAGLGAGVIVDCAVFQDSGGGLNVNAALIYSPEFWIQRVS